MTTFERMAPECTQSTPTMRPAHALHAIADYYGTCRTDWPLSDVVLCAAAWYHCGAVDVVRGVAATRGEDGRLEGAPYCWVRADGRDYDLLQMARRRRHACFGSAPPSEHELVECSGSPAPLAPGLDAELLKDALQDIADYKLPTCPGCRGRHRAHACDGSCQSPWKDRPWRF